MSRLNKILFLDVDGVLNAVGTTRQKFNGMVGIDPSMLVRLKRILSETQCSIVLSSTWRKFPAWRAHLMEALGPDALFVIGDTPGPDFDDKSGLWIAKTRGDEIRAWLDANPGVERFCVLDDDDDMGILSLSMVRTNTFEGLTEKQADEVIKRLNEE